MMNLTSKTSKSLLLFKRALVLLCFVLCSLMANALGSSWKANYQVNVNGSTISTGQGTVYLSANVLVNDQQGSGVDDSKGDISKSIPSVTATYTGSLTLDYEQTVAGSRNNYYRTKTNYENITLKAEAAPGSKFVKWANDDASTNPRVIKELAEFSCTNSGGTPTTQTHSTTFIPIFTAKTYYYKEPGADATEGGKVYISTTAGRPAEDSGDWQTTIAGGTTTLSQTADDNGRYARATVKVYCYAKSSGEDYEFVGWFANTGGSLSNSLDYEYDFVVTSENSGQPTTNTLYAVFRPKMTITTINADNVDDINLYTGTEIFQEGHATYGKSPYRQKTRLDLRPTFAPDGTPIFDKLYVFEMTTSCESLNIGGVVGHNIIVASNTIGSNAITPCYIYTNNGTGGYDLTQTILNMNVANKPIQDISGTTKVYLTGYCPYASTGGKDAKKDKGDKNDNGVFCFTGGAGETIDVYIDDLELIARYKSYNGNISMPDTVLYDKFSTEMRCTGTSTAFAFRGTSNDESNPFCPTIHIRDSNRLAGNTGSAVHVKIEYSGYGVNQVAGQYNSPIGIITDADDQYTELSIDDVWPASMFENAENNVRTNGILDIRTTQAAPCIDLYDDNGKVNFNGGRIWMKNSTPSGSNNYLCTFAIGYRKYSKTVTIPVVDIDITVSMFGLGTDQSGSVVNFNDGTFYILPLTENEFNTHQSYYHHRDALKCPATTTINGGTYYCEPFACTESTNKGASPLNRYGDGLVLDTVAVESLLEPYHTAVINFPNDKEVQAEYDATYPATLGDYYTAKGTTYGVSSLNPYQGTQAPDSVILMLPVQYTNKELQIEVSNVPWALCVPEVVAGGTMSMGGNVEVLDREENNTIYQTNYLLYGALDEYIDAIAGEYQTPVYDGLPQADVEFSGAWSSDIENEDSFTIQKEQYMLMSVKGDEWVLFSPPFDISEVYVIETSKENDLEAIATNEGWLEAINRQATANMDFFYALCYNVGYLKSVNSLDLIYHDWTVELANGAKGKIKLDHFTGSNYTANYYLQRSSGTWEWDAEKERFVTDWEYLPKTMEKVTHGDTEYSVVMKKGEIYSMKFPYMYYGYRDPELIGKTGEKNWDYWTGKYILLVGKGPQTIEGKNYHNTITATMTATLGNAEVRVNPTFSALEINNMGAYYLSENQRFTKAYDDNEPALILPTSGFVLANTNTPTPMPQRIKSIDLVTGEVTTEPGVSTSTPTIAGNKQMMVYNIEGGVGIVPVVEQQVSIYNAAGQLVTSQYLTDEVHIPLPTGIYLIAGAKDQFKAVVK